MNGGDYIKIVNETIKAAYETQGEELTRAAAELAAAVEAKHNVFVFGCSHAGILAEEVFYRTGGLAVINPIFFPGMMLNTRPITMTSALERLPGLGRIIFEKNRVQRGDMLLLVPNNIAVTGVEDLENVAVYWGNIQLGDMRMNRMRIMVRQWLANSLPVYCAMGKPTDDRDFFVEIGFYGKPSSKR